MSPQTTTQKTGDDFWPSWDHQDLGRGPFMLWTNSAAEHKALFWSWLYLTGFQGRQTSYLSSLNEAVVRNWVNTGSSHFADFSHTPMLSESHILYAHSPKLWRRPGRAITCWFACVYPSIAASSLGLQSTRLPGCDVSRVHQGSHTELNYIKM